MTMCSRSSRVSGDLPQREVMSHFMLSYVAANQESANGLFVCESPDGKKTKNKTDLDVQKQSPNAYIVGFFPLLSFYCCSDVTKLLAPCLPV